MNLKDIPKDKLNIYAEDYVNKFWYEQIKDVQRKMQMAYIAGFIKGKETPVSAEYWSENFKDWYLNYPTAIEPPTLKDIVDWVENNKHLLNQPQPPVSEEEIEEKFKLKFGYIMEAEEIINWIKKYILHSYKPK